MFCAPVIDLDDFRGGKLPSDLALAVKAAYRARGQSQGKFAFEIASTHTNINETIDGTVFARWRTDSTYRPTNLLEWAAREF